MRKRRITAILLSTVQIDGLDATNHLIDMVKGSNRPVDLIVAGSVCLAGFNLLDLNYISSTLGIPVIVTVGEKPRTSRVEAALKKHFPDWHRRLAVIDSVHPLRRMLVNNRSVYVAAVGVEFKKAAELVRGLAVLGKIPEPLRCAQILARGLSGVIA
jgi:endonuclease V-like protein UPF0215 family